MHISSHNPYMSLAIELAKKGCFSVSPNPMVGCVIVKNGQIIGQGYHKKFGESHAEINALNEAGNQAKDSTVYVNLEPCCHFGKTPPCADRLIQSGIKEIFIANKDPNPLVAGKGIQALENAGIQVHLGLYEKEAFELNKVFYHFIKNKTPYIISKWAMSLDGKTVTNQNDSKQISSKDSQIHTHQTRQKVDAILIGAETARHDNPKLTVRYADDVIKQPIKIIVAGQKSLPKDLHVLNPTPSEKTILVTTHENAHLFEDLKSENLEILSVQSNDKHQVSLKNLLIQLGQKNISSVLVEGGVKIRESFFEENLVNEVQVYLSSNIIGNLSPKQSIYNLHVQSVGSDYFCTGYPNEVSNV